MVGGGRWGPSVPRSATGAISWAPALSALAVALPSAPLTAHASVSLSASVPLDSDDARRSQLASTAHARRLPSLSSLSLTRSLFLRSRPWFASAIVAVSYSM